LAQKRGKPWLPEHIAPAKFIAELGYNIQYFFAEVNGFIRALLEIRKFGEKGKIQPFSLECR
jgi:hypothetical protein